MRNHDLHRDSGIDIIDHLHGEADLLGHVALLLNQHLALFELLQLKYLYDLAENVDEKAEEWMLAHENEGFWALVVFIICFLPSFLRSSNRLRMLYAHYLVID